MMMEIANNIIFYPWIVQIMEIYNNIVKECVLTIHNPSPARLENVLISLNKIIALM